MPFGIGVGLIPSIDDGTLQRRFEPHLDLKEVRSLGELEAGVSALLPQTHTSGTGEHLPRDEKWREVPHDVAEGRGPAHQVVLMTAVGRALVIRIVFVQLNGERTRAGRRHRGIRHDLHPRAVPQDSIPRIRDLWAAVLRMGVVDVQACSVRQNQIG